MVKKIIQEGAKTFVADCYDCGCQFSYAISDCIGSSSNREVSCPQCGRRMGHPVMRLPPRHTL